jgi:hypothetical protein
MWIRQSWAKEAELTLQNAPRGRPAQRSMRFIDLSQQLDVGSCVPGTKPMPLIARRRHPPGSGRAAA